MVGTEVADAPANTAPPDSSPPDAATVRLAIRLGWYMAELRGRYWWQGPRPAVTTLPVDPPYGLPLRAERTEAESRHQSCQTVDSLARRLGVEAPFAAREPDGTDHAERFSVRFGALTAPLEADADLLSAVDRSGPDAQKRDDAWIPVARLLHEWD